MFATERLLNIALHLQRKLRREDAGILSLILFKNIRLNRAANILQHLASQSRVSLRINNAISWNAEQA